MSESGTDESRNIRARVSGIMRRVGEVLSEHFTDGDLRRPGSYEGAIDAQYKELALVLTVRLTVEGSGDRTIAIVSHEVGDPPTKTPLFTAHWNTQGNIDIKLWLNGPWEALFLAGDIVGTA